MYRRSRNRIFSGSGSIREYFKPIVQSITSEIENLSEDYILNVSEEQFSEYMINKYTIDFPEIEFDNVQADSYEKEINISDYPHIFRGDGAEKHKAQIVCFYIPVNGNSEILKYCPGINSITISGGQCDFEVSSSKLKLEVPNFYNDPKKVKDTYEENSRNIHRKLDDLLSDIRLFNNSLSNSIMKSFRNRKSSFMKKNEFMSSLGVPLKQNLNTPQTFSVPNPILRTKIAIDRPSVKNETFRPEPTLNSDVYNHILKLINDLGKNFERMPSIYKDKGEEDLRDHIIMVLDPNFQYGSATGETFNKTGKTDIQLRYDSSVVFIAECKFWTGEKGYLNTIDQLLGYLTWRDTKASIIIFARQKDFSAIISKVYAVTPTHSNYLGFVSKSDENWFNYRFHINGDKNREIKLAIQLYHLS
ncbi:hypothetical protein [Flavobacterium sp. C4GT6]|uniref:hypothetical protein n=1 Tax=Flavobacterium sp. C4GT6 TaxID=3103818 RepID=UPI002ED64D8A